MSDLVELLLQEGQEEAAVVLEDFSNEIDRLRLALTQIVELAGPSGKTAAHQWGAAFAIAQAALVPRG